MAPHVKLKDHPCIFLFRVCLDCRIFIGFLEDVVPKEKKYECVWKRERRFLFQRKGKHPVRTNGNHAGTYHSCLRSFCLWIERADKIVQEREWMLMNKD